MCEPSRYNFIFAGEVFPLSNVYNLPSDWRKLINMIFIFVSFYFVELPSVCLELFLPNCECSLEFSENEDFESPASTFGLSNFS